MEVSGYHHNVAYDFLSLRPALYAAGRARCVSAISPMRHCHDYRIAERLLGLAVTGVAAAALRRKHRRPSTADALPPGLPQPTETIDLWPDGAPGMPASALIETVNERSTDAQLTDRAVFGITRPRMAVFRPSRPNGAAVMITPGGGYRWVVVDKEGYEMGRWLSARGLHRICFILSLARRRLGGRSRRRAVGCATCDASDPLSRERLWHRPRTGRRDGFFGRRAFMLRPDSPLCDANLSTPSIKADTLSARPFVSAPIYPVVSMCAPFAHIGQPRKADRIKAIISGREIALAASASAGQRAAAFSSSMPRMMKSCPSKTACCFVRPCAPKKCRLKPICSPMAATVLVCAKPSASQPRHGRSFLSIGQERWHSAADIPAVPTPQFGYRYYDPAPIIAAYNAKARGGA